MMRRFKGTINSRTLLDALVNVHGTVWKNTSLLISVRAVRSSEGWEATFDLNPIQKNFVILNEDLEPIQTFSPYRETDFQAIIETYRLIEEK